MKKYRAPGKFVAIAQAKAQFLWIMSKTKGEPCVAGPFFLFNSEKRLAFSGKIRYFME